MRTRLTPELLTAQAAAVGLPGYDGPDDPPRLRAACVDIVLAARDLGVEPERSVVKGAVRALLDELAARAPGRAVEVRVPPYAVVQCISGVRHTRGTPPNVVETDPETWIGLATGRIGWSAAMEQGLIRAGGTRADLSEHLPLR